MKYIKKGLITFIPILIIILLLKVYISTQNFKINLENILKTSGLNIEVSEVKLINLNKIEMENLIVKDIYGNTVINAKKAKASINLLTPTRLSRVDVYDSEIFLERDEKNKFNVYNILPPEDPNKIKTIDRVSRIGKIYINNSKLYYTDTAYKEKIEKKLEKVYGYLEVSKTRGFSLNAKGSSGTEKIGISLDYLSNNEASLKSIFNSKNNNLPENKEFKLKFEFDNVNLDRKITQYIPLDIIKINSGKLDGNLQLYDKAGKGIKVTGKLKAQNTSINYRDYSDELKNISSEINLEEKNIDLKAETKIKNAPLKLNLNYKSLENKLKLSLDIKDMPYKEIEKYKLLRDLKIDIKANITGNLDVDVDTKKQEVEVGGKFSTPNLKLYGYNLSNFNSKIKVTKKSELIFEDVFFHFDKEFSNFKVKNDVKIGKFKYELKNKKGIGDYTLENKGSDYDINEIKGTISINDKNILNGKFYSNRIDGNYEIDIINKKAIIKAKGKDFFDIKYGGETYKIKPTIHELNLNFNKENIIDYGRLNIKLKSVKKAVYDEIDANVELKDSNYNVDALINIDNQVIRAKGITTKDFVHSYNITTLENSSINVEKIGKKLGYKEEILQKIKMPIKINANIQGKDNKILGNYEIYSNYGELFAEYEKLYVKGKINDLQSLNIDGDVNIEELWLNYQRLKNIKSNFNLKNDILEIKANNEKFKTDTKYELKSGELKTVANLKNYILYNTSNHELNVNVNNLSLDLSGKLDNLNGNIVLSPSITTLKNQIIGNLAGNVEIKNNLLNLNSISLKDNKLYGSYNLNNGIANLNLEVNESNIADLINDKSFTLRSNSKYNLKGKLNDFTLLGEMNLDNISYKTYKIPKISTKIKYENGDIGKIFNKGTLDIQDFTLLSQNSEKLFSTSTKFDLENVDIDYKLENQKFMLDASEDLKNKGYSGEVDLSLIFRGNQNKFFTDVQIDSKKIVLNGFPVDNLDLDIQANNSGMNIGQIYVEYEKNPLLVNGYIGFASPEHNLSILAKDFNLGFLGVNKEVENASGLANINMILSNNGTRGDILLDNFSYKTKDKVVNVDKINANIDVKNNKLEIRRLDGGYNGGLFKVSGNLDVPTIPENFFKTKRIELGKIDIDGNLNKVGVRYGKDINLVLTGDLKFTENNLYGSILVDSGEIRGISDFSGKKKELSEEEKEKILAKKTIVEGVIEEVIDKIIKQYTVNLNVQTTKDLKLNIKNISLIKNLSGEIIGGSRIFYNSGDTNIMGNYVLKKGSFALNNNSRFKIENAEIRFEDPLGTLSNMNPFVLFEATTDINGEKISINVNGNLKEPNVIFKSDSGLSKEQIFSLLAFNKVLISSDKDKFNIKTIDKSTSTSQIQEDVVNAAILGTVVNTTLNRLIFSPVTDKIENIFGLTNFSINTDFSKNQKNEKYGAATSIYIQDSIFKDKVFWNLELKFPFQGEEKEPFKYNTWINYNLENGIELKVGGQTVTKGNKIKMKELVSNKKEQNVMNYYVGLNFSAKDYTLKKLIKKIFERKKLETLTK